MKLWKKITAFLAVGASVLVLAACGNSTSKQGSKGNPVKVGIMTNDEPIWKNIKSRLQKQDVYIKLVTFTDYNRPNQALTDGDIQLNSFQHHEFLNEWNKKHNTKIADIGATYIGPMRAYSNKIKKITDLKKGDTVSLPNDASNEGRALQLLQDYGLIKVKQKATPTIRDITENKLNLKFTELDAAQTARSLNDVDASVVNNDIAAAAKLDPSKAIAVEKINAKSKPWVNFIAAKSSKDKNNKVYKKIVKAYQTKKTASLLKKYYKGSTLPAWNYKF